MMCECALNAEKKKKKYTRQKKKYIQKEWKIWSQEFMYCVCSVVWSAACSYLYLQNKQRIIIIKNIGGIK